MVFGNSMRENSAVIEQDFETPHRANAQMMAATSTDIEIGLELAVKQHLLATRTFFPQIIRYILFADDSADLGQNKIG